MEITKAPGLFVQCHSLLYPHWICSQSNGRAFFLDRGSLLANFIGSPISTHTKIGVPSSKWGTNIFISPLPRSCRRGEWHFNMRQERICKRPRCGKGCRFANHTLLRPWKHEQKPASSFQASHPRFGRSPVSKEHTPRTPLFRGAEPNQEPLASFKLPQLSRNRLGLWDPQGAKMCKGHLMQGPAVR